jgi:hypothetical protein
MHAKARFTMFVLQTTTAILIAFLAVVAYSRLRNRLAKNTLTRRYVWWLGGSAERMPNDVETSIRTKAVQAPAPASETTRDMEMEAHKQLYYKLHNLENHAEILPECRQLLLSLMSSTLNDALEEPNSGILSIQEFTVDRLNQFLKSKDADATNRWEDYLARRKCGGSREMFADHIEARWWLKQAAMVKYVDGAWLGHINKISTPFAHRNVTKNAWQVMSEELGDGDLAKNHVHVYRKLMDDIGAGLPAADSKDFIHPRHELNEARCWKAAVAQLLISLFAHDFLPEALGFNMAYESLPLHLLKTVKELRELRLDPYYFELHVSIDNADSGHAAMAMSAVVDYIELVGRDQGQEAAHKVWKRVQAGYVLAEGLPTTPESPSTKTSKTTSGVVAQKKEVRLTDTETALLGIFAAKSSVAHKIHCNSRLKIGRRSLVDWLEPNAFMEPQWQRDFLHDLGNCKPWVIRGDSSTSRLVKELSWEGKMFGSFTQTEVEVVARWIDELDLPASQARPESDVYLAFTGQLPQRLSIDSRPLDILVCYPVFTNRSSTFTTVHNPTHVSPIDIAQKKATVGDMNLLRLLPLWFASLALLESLPSVPVRAADAFGSAIVRVLRAQAGFGCEGPGVAGMDEVRRTDDGQAMGIVELGLEMYRRMGADEPRTLTEVLSFGSAGSREFAEWMIGMSMRWLANRDVLVGMAWRFMEMHEAVAQLDGDCVLLSPESNRILHAIAARERRGLEVCRNEIERDRQRMRRFQEGVAIASQAIHSCSV